MPEKTALFKEIAELEEKTEAACLPPELKEKCLHLIERLSRMIKYGEYSTEYERVSHYIDWITALPWEKRSEDRLDLEAAKKILDENHYGLEETKERILEYLAVMRLKREGKEERKEEGILKFMRAPMLLFVGLVGTGKTTIAYSIAEAMGRKFARVPFGGLGDPLDLRGQSRIRPDAEPGLIIKALRRTGTKNSVLLLDEIDRVTEDGRSSIMGVLVELLDPEQNMAFRDHFIDYSFDLSEVLFIATCNNTSNISVAVMDRLEPIQMPSYTDEEKIKISKDYVLPRTIQETGLDKEAIRIDPDVWPKIVRPLGYDAGIRTLERTINGICRKVAKMIVQGKGRSFHITSENVKEFLPTW
ncbi:MAG TPA: AAA family ATPase [Patescibacteria group bacterium]|nr:AAA family ATPase [Patescibacteria group bacterium]